MIPDKLLWIDCSGGILVGIGVLTLRGWLAGLYLLPESLLLGIGAANLLYGCYSLSLALRPGRGRGALLALIVANAGWSVACVALTVRFWSAASVLGLAALMLEAVFVGGLAALEWRWRRELSDAPPVT